ncbi:4-hydroxybenzoate solanesyltransferase [Candidatus Kinetoplastibacterium sorsogonicusi]|uniref:4-hydroxybenzoate octaprenyltransferase n=1 Tax=Candidatus Kinetoplastidibacterium kentomonadis TaxID=1576550 RepID=A0A3S7JAR5_9PROT|nr:4-hydroxybenzoate octaprenyltransferase [Candidatus Kinetoplastibacterium sorsogonicusi]AWD32761.1 4-hydroxybenzoate solanesyltransferase [Candidatus Kinetoplastibacterium sorsogonicusi]
MNKLKINTLGKYIQLCRLDNPIGIWLALLPCIASLIQASDGIPNLNRLFIFSLGAIMLRSIGCTINDIFDRNFDCNVERTKNRPIANSTISVINAIYFLILQCIFCIPLIFFINKNCLLLSILLIPLIIFYPLCKRITYWPQLILGICFNFGILMAWIDTRNNLSLSAIFMWLGSIFWQIGYDTIYAYSDIKDDLKIGIKSTAILFKESGKKYISIFYILTIIMWTINGILLSYNRLYFLGILIISIHFIWQVFSFNINLTFNDDKYKNIKIFRSNLLIGVIVTIVSYLGLF